MSGMDSQQEGADVTSSPDMERHTEYKGLLAPGNGGSPSPPDTGHRYSQECSPREIHIVAPAPQFRRFGNAAAMSLAAFGICQIQKSMMDAGIGVGYGHGSESLTGSFLAVAGITQMLGGLWQIANGDTFEGAAFTTFGSRWLARGFSGIPGTGVIDFQRSEPPDIVRKQNGIGSLPWCIWVFIMMAGNVKSHIANIFMFLTLNLETDFGCAGEWTNDKRIIKTAGWFGFFCGLSAFYNAAAIILNRDNFWFNLPVGHWYTPRAAADEEARA